MARFEIPQGWVAQGYRFALDPTKMQIRELQSHAGGARFACNSMLAAVKANLDERSAERSYGFCRARPHTQNWLVISVVAQGMEPPQAHYRLGTRRRSVVATEFEGGVRQRLPRLIAGIGELGVLAHGRAPRTSHGLSSIQDEIVCGKEFSFSTGAIRVEPDRHHITLPRLGSVRTHESTRKLARRLEGGKARILKATVRFDRGRWWVSLTCLVQRVLGRPGHVRCGAPVVGIDVGIKDLVVVADPAGNELVRYGRCMPPGFLDRQLRALHRKASRQIGPWDTAKNSRRVPSHAWHLTQRTIARLNARSGYIRADRIHKLTSALTKSHEVIGVESLGVKTMMRAGGARKCGLNRALGNSALGTLIDQLDYKALVRLTSRPADFSPAPKCARAVAR